MYVRVQHRNTITQNSVPGTAVWLTLEGAASSCARTSTGTYKNGSDVIQHRCVVVSKIRYGMVRKDYVKYRERHEHFLSQQILIE